MPKRTGEYNIGLLAELTPAQLEIIRAVGFIGDKDGWARLAMARCVLCHARREVEFTGRQLTRCSGVQSNSYNYLEQLSDTGLVAETRREKPTRFTPKGVTWYQVVSPTTDRAVDNVPLPTQCPEIRSIE
jgi:hypothetical protein